MGRNVYNMHPLCIYSALCLKLNYLKIIILCCSFEKYFGGKYLGDLVREALVTLAEENLFCTGPSETLRTRGSLPTKAVSMLDG